MSETQKGCSLVNVIFPLFLLGGTVAGCDVGSHYGTLPAILGAVGGFFLSVPAMGLTLLVMLGIAWLVDRLVGWRGK